jgi:RimJ/RimL family protein N-acetyltransferase
MNVVCETERLYIRQFNTQDTEFIVRLLNNESFIRNITDKKVRTDADALRYLNNGPLFSYQTYGYGLSLVLLKETKTPIGMCGLLKRDELDSPDLGYALLPEFCGKGYAIEASSSLINTEMDTYSLKTILAVTFLNNIRSNSLLNKIGFKLKGQIELYQAQNIYMSTVVKTANNIINNEKKFAVFVAQHYSQLYFSA